MHYLMKCHMCDSKLDTHITPWIYKCPGCGHFISTLKPHIEGKDENFRELDKKEGTLNFLDTIRTQNFNLVLNRLSNFFDLKGKLLLDVGCAEGLFLSVCKNHSIEGEGIEPNETLFNSAINNKVNVRKGYFPSVLAKDEKFDIITFNDVLEHIENVHEIIRNCSTYLKENGVLIICVPNSKGFIFCVSTVLARFGFLAPYERLWQKQFFTPHLHYFSHNTLNKLCVSHGFREELRLNLPSVSINGLWSRLKIDGTSTFFGRIISYLCVLIAYPLLNILPSDSIVHIYRNNSIPK